MSMVCDQEYFASSESWMKHFRDKAMEQRIPVSTMLELTHHCNLDCAHCYLGSIDERADHSNAHDLDTDHILGIIDNLQELGVLFLTITGGDPLKRPDFPKIYRYAVQAGMVVSVYCNGTLLTEQHVELFKAYPPRTVDITLYGATEKTYEKVTGIPGSYRRCINGIELMLKNDIRVSLKTVLMTLNQHEVGLMEEMAETYGIPFRGDAVLFPCLTGSKKDPSRLRVRPDQAVEWEMSRTERVQQWVTFYESRKDNNYGERLYHCGAGVTGAFVDADGAMSPCLMSVQYKESVIRHDMKEVWYDRLPKLGEKKVSSDYSCNSCHMRAACTSCPAQNYLDNGREDIKSDYVCDITEKRYDYLMTHTDITPPVEK